MPQKNINPNSKPKSKQQPAQNIQLSAQLGKNFFTKLKEVSNSLSIKPEDLLAIMTLESRLDPALVNRIGATGLVQFKERTLKGVGWKGSIQDFSRASGETQLDYVKKLIQQNMTLNGNKPFDSVAKFYISNLFPAALKLPGVRNKDRNARILEADPIGTKGPDGTEYSKKYADVGFKSKETTVDFEKRAFAANSGLAKLLPGVAITYGDIEDKMESIRKNPIYLKAVEQLNKSSKISLTPPKPARKSDLSLPEDATLPQNINRDELEQFLAEYGSEFAPPGATELDPSLLDDLIQSYLEKSASINLEKQHILIKVNSNNKIDSLECASILVNALDEELLSTSFVHHDYDQEQIEIQCGITGPRMLAAKAVKHISDCVIDSFNNVLNNKNTNNQVNISLLLNKKSSYQEASLKSLETNHRKFLLKIS